MAHRIVGMRHGPGGHVGEVTAASSGQDMRDGCLVLDEPH